jgi:hypothetical protein
MLALKFFELLQYFTPYVSKPGTKFNVVSLKVIRYKLYVSITKKGITRGFHKKNMFIKNSIYFGMEHGTSEDGIVCQNILSSL